MSAVKGEHGPPNKRSALSPSNCACPANSHPWPALFINYAEPGQHAWHQACSTVNPQHAAWQAYPEQVAARAATLGSLPLVGVYSAQNGLYSAGLPTQGQAALSQAGLRGHMHSLQPHTLNGYVLQSNAGHAPHQVFFVKDPHMFIMLSPRGHTLTIGNHSYGIPHQCPPRRANPTIPPQLPPRPALPSVPPPSWHPTPLASLLDIVKMGAGISVLIVSDDELDVRDDVVAASSEVAEDSTREGLNHMGIALGSWGWACKKTFMIIWEVGICVLVVGNDKLNVGEDELNDVAMSSEVAEDETCGKG
ncbi:hypothetical protein BC827DRAFT_1158102 [Russula dissimulans]|nr:hypothetical protein BC827DRAFT_1158102 [Russula dissimulans]